MAEIETKRILTIDAGKSLQTLRQLREAVDANRQALSQLDKASEEYDRELVKGKALQGEYNAALRLAAKESKAAAGSYDALTVQLAKLKKEWKATGDEARRQQLTAEINKVKGQLDRMDHSIGNWQRNVGNYWGSLKEGLGKLAVALVAVRSAFKIFEGAMQETQNTGDALRNTINGVKDSYHTLMAAVVSGDWSAFSGGFWAVYDAAVAASDAIDQLQNTQLAFDYLTQENTTKFNEQYNIWKDKASTEEQKEAAKKQMREIIDAQYEYAKNYNKQALDAYRALVVKEAGEANITLGRVTAEQFRKAMLIDVSSDPEKARAEIDHEYNAYLTKLKAYGENNIVAQDNLKKQYADVIAIHAMLKLMKDDELKGLADILKGMESAKQSAQAMERRMLRAGGSTGESGTTAAGGSTKEKAVDYALAIAEDENYFTEEVELTKETQKELDDIHKRGADYRKQLQDQELADLQQYADGYVRQLEYMNSRQKELEDADIREREYKMKVQEQIDKERRQSQEDAITALQSVIGSTASAYEGLINARLQSGKINQQEAESEFKLVKAFQVSQTWINTLAGMMGIWGNGEPAPWYVKAAQSAALLAQGVAATTQIASTQIGQGGSGSAGVAQAVQAAPVVVNMPSQVRTVTSASDEVALNERNQAQRVVLVYSDLQAFGKKVQVSQQESQF